MDIKCPYCNKEQKYGPKKTWEFGKLIKNRTKEKTTWGASINCSQYYCTCGKPFRFYLSANGKYWTIPKSKITTK
jgi:hypothetical protein